MVFEFERQAMNGEPLPDGLSQEDQLLYLQLSILYERYKAGFITRERGAADKRKLFSAYENQKRKNESARKLVDSVVKMYKDMEYLLSEYRKNPSLEIADKIVFKIDNPGKDVV